MAYALHELRNAEELGHGKGDTGDVRVVHIAPSQRANDVNSTYRDACSDDEAVCLKHLTLGVVGD